MYFVFTEAEGQYFAEIIIFLCIFQKNACISLGSVIKLLLLFKRKYVEKYISTVYLCCELY